MWFYFILFHWFVGNWLQCHPNTNFVREFGGEKKKIRSPVSRSQCLQNFRNSISSFRVLVHHFYETTLPELLSIPLLLKTKAHYFFFSLIIELLKAYCLVATSTLQGAQFLAYREQLPWIFSYIAFTYFLINLLNIPVPWFPQ